MNASLRLLAGLMGLLCAASAVQAAHLTPANVLNFALNLEYLEANFYWCAAYGKPIPSEHTMGGMGQPAGAVLGCDGKKNRLSEKAKLIAAEIAWDELGHVKFLRAALGNASVAQPKIDIGPAFVAAANTAVDVATGGQGFKLKPAFNPYASDLFFYHGAFVFEDVGVTAYQGAAAVFGNDAPTLTAAAGILAVEAYHAGVIRHILFEQASKVVPFKNIKLRVREVVEAISGLRDFADSLDGDASDKDQGITLKGFNTSPNLVPTDEAGRITFARTPEQVLRIVYLGGKDKGGFFPDGLNGVIKAVP